MGRVEEKKNTNEGEWRNQLTRVDVTRTERLLRRCKPEVQRKVEL